MPFPKFLKRKTTYAILILLVAGGWWFFAQSRNKGPHYETAVVTRGTLRQTVQVTGELKPATRTELAFKNPGTIAAINVKIGDTVKTGDILATLKANDVQFAAKNARAMLAVAQANLNAKKAGDTPQIIRVAETQVEQAEAQYKKAVSDVDSNKKTTQDAVTAAQIALQTAKNDLDNQNAIVAQDIQNSIDAARLQLLAALGPLNSGLSDGDQISGVDNTAANQLYLNVLGFLDMGSLDRSKASYLRAKTAKLDAETFTQNLTPSSTKDDVQSAAEKIQSAITAVQSYLSDVQKVLISSLTDSMFTKTTLSADKAMINGDRTTVSAQNTAVLSVLQTIKNTELMKIQTIQRLKNAYKAAQTAYQTATTNADVQVRAAETNVAIQKAALDSAQAMLDLKKSGPRAVDLAPLHATVEQAQVAYNRSLNDLKNVQIIAPVDGIISDVIPDIGERISPNVPEINMVGTQSYDIQAQVPEADITKVLVGQTASTTLDAYGDGVQFGGKVTSKDPAETRIQDAIYYNVHVQLNSDGHEVKPGMTANVTVNTGEADHALIIPLRAVRTDAQTGIKTVRILVNGIAKTKKVKLGLRGDEGLIQVLHGLSEGDQVIVGQTGTSASKG